MSPHEAKVRERYPDAALHFDLRARTRGEEYAIRCGGRTLGLGPSPEAAWTNALRAIDPDDRTPLPGQATFL